MDKRPALGKGLSALIPDAPTCRCRRATASGHRFCSRPTTTSRAARSTKGLEELAPIDSGQGRHPASSRQAFGNGYRIIAGERRWRAAQRAGLMKVPVVGASDVRATPRSSISKLALIENIQRENLNPLEESLGYQRLTEEFGLTQEQVAAGGRQGSQHGGEICCGCSGYQRRSGPSWPPAR
jgi:ParB family chromosome partitioning protein